MNQAPPVPIPTPHPPIFSESPQNATGSNHMENSIQEGRVDSNENNDQTHAENHIQYDRVDANENLFQVYGETIMCNDGTNIEGTIQDDREWQEHWKIVVNLHNRKYDLPKNSTGKKIRYTSYGNKKCSK